MLKEHLKERAALSGSPKGTCKKEHRPMPAYSLVSEKLRKSSSGSVQCSLFCGGQSCKYETPLQWGAEDKALRGLYSHWVTPNLLAMARPSTFLFRVYDVIGQFKSLGVCSVINLQVAWEHSKCGPGLEGSGFTYHPQDLMREGVFYYNFGWSDYSVPTLEVLLDTVKVLDFALTQGKVAIHCHAGLGRTGLLIACHMVYSQRIPANEAIAHVRVKRPGSIQTRSQIETVQLFAAYLSTLWTFHPTLKLCSGPGSEVNITNLGDEKSTSNDIENRQTSTQRSKVAWTHSDSIGSATRTIKCGNNQLTFDDLLRNQGKVLHGDSQLDLKLIPKALHDVCARISERSHDRHCDVITHCTNGGCCKVNSDLISCLKLCCYDNHMKSTILPSIQAIKSEMNSSLDWPLLEREDDLRMLLGLVATFFSSLKAPFLAPEDVAILDSTHKLTALSPSRLHTITHLLTTLNTLLTRHLHCNQHECLVSILTELCPKLAALFIQFEESVGLKFVTIISEVLIVNCLTIRTQ